MSERKVPVAYVTKYAETRGIVVVRDAEETEGGALSAGDFSGSSLWVAKGHWTEDKAIAEERYRAALRRALNSAEEKVRRIQAALDAPPKYEEES